jgi:hypothetical protein
LCYRDRTAIAPEDKTAKKVFSSEEMIGKLVASGHLTASKAQSLIEEAKTNKFPSQKLTNLLRLAPLILADKLSIDNAEKINDDKKLRSLGCTTYLILANKLSVEDVPESLNFDQIAALSNFKDMLLSGYMSVEDIITKPENARKLATDFAGANEVGSYIRTPHDFLNAQGLLRRVLKVSSFF